MQSVPVTLEYINRFFEKSVISCKLKRVPNVNEKNEINIINTKYFLEGISLYFV